MNMGDIGRLPLAKLLLLMVIAGKIIIKIRVTIQIRIIRIIVMGRLIVMLMPMSGRNRIKVSMF